MRLNEIKPAAGSRRQRKRVGRGSASGSGKTAGRGHKGEKARAGGGRSAGFEGGQMPLQRRLPKFGFTSRSAPFNAEVRLDAVSRLDSEVIDAATLKSARLVDRRATRIKLVASGKLDRAVTVRGLAVTKGARAAVEAAGGRVED
jgi:large subunit ribosomal protein L15